MAKQYGNFTDFISVARASSGTCLRKVKFGQDIYSEIVDKYISNGNTDGTWSTDTGLLALDWVPVTANTYYQLVAVGGPADRYRYQFKLSDDSYTTAVTDDQTWLTKTLKTPANAVEMRVYYKSGAGTASSMTVRSAELDHKDGELILFNHPENVARVEYDEYGRVIGTLIEESRTNLYETSEDTIVTYASGTNKTSDASAWPTGEQTADLMVPDTTNAAHFFGNPLSYSAGVSNETYSFFAKASGYYRFRVYLANQTGGYQADFDLFAETATNTGSLGQSIVNVGNGWYRCSMTFLSTKTNPYPSIKIFDASGNETFAGDGTSGIYFVGHQLEAGAFPTSYIPTSGSSATRAADIDSIDVSQFGYNQKAGTVVVTASSWGTSNSSYPRLFEVNNGSGANRVSLWINTSNNIALAANASSVSQVNTTVKYSYSPNTEVTVAYGFRQDDYAGSADGATIVTDATGDLPTTMTDLYIGQQHSSGQIINGHIKSIKYYPRRLTNTQLQEQTA